MDYKSVFTNLCLELQQNRSWIKGLGKNPQKSELIHWRQCLLSGGTEACSLGPPRNTGVYTRHPTFVTATSGVLTRLPAKLSKNGMCVYTLSDRRSKKNCVYTRPPKRRGSARTEISERSRLQHTYIHCVEILLFLCTVKFFKPFPLKIVFGADFVSVFPL